ncbi:MAG: FAD binding domain-containing protein [Gemmatimonadota bacterium]
MQTFEYHRPDSADAAVAAMREATEAKFLAGGQSLIPVMKLDLAAPSDLISLGGVPDLVGIEEEGGEIVIGAMTTHAAVEESELVAEKIPALVEMMGVLGDPQVRNRGTIGGSLAHNDPAADYPAAALGLNATIVTDRRRVASDDFFEGMFTTALAEDELITSVRFPVPDAAGYHKIRSPSSRYALVGVLVSRASGGVRVAVTGARRGVYRWSEAESALASDFSPEALADLDHPTDGVVSDPDASAEYRAHLVSVAARRAVTACL